LLESELFGYEKGAFTGAQQRKLGKFEYANEGTIFLDEISEMSPGLQAKLLHVLQDGAFSRLGGHGEVQVDTRIVAATNRNLEEEVKKGTFREDLYYRLNVVTIQLPALRERRDAIPLLVDHFLRKYGKEYNRELVQLSPELMDQFIHNHWSGNVRELENMVKRIVVLGGENAVLSELQACVPDQPEVLIDADEAPPLDGVAEALVQGEPIDLKAIAKRASRMAEKRVISRVLNDTRWNRKEAAERLKISYKALLYKMKENGLGERP
jgi:two-component system response regulator AtoC